jgi:DNA-binding PadR family transcriptional regulator
MPLPDITHLQFLLIAALLDGEHSGRDLRELLAREKHRMSGPAFYQLMARLEDAKLITGKYKQKLVEGKLIKERVYTMTGAGKAACEAVRDFYANIAARQNLGLEGA